MFAQVARVRPFVAAWFLASILALGAVATALAGGGGAPYPH
ncbi:MAG: hypothetical protein ACLQBX_14500 [Candidatus Limnocylindrales bacterium]